MSLLFAHVDNLAKARHSDILNLNHKGEVPCGSSCFKLDEGGAPSAARGVGQLEARYTAVPG